MIQTVLFGKVSIDLHKGIKVRSAVRSVPTYKIYSDAMEEFSAKMKEDHLPINYSYGPADEYKDIRVEKADSRIYKNFKITCIQKDISISQGINLALTDWLEDRK